MLKKPKLQLRSGCWRLGRGGEAPRQGRAPKTPGDPGIGGGTRQELALRYLLFLIQRAKSKADPQTGRRGHWPGSWMWAQAMGTWLE